MGEGLKDEYHERTVGNDCSVSFSVLGLSNEATGNEKETKDISLRKHAMACRHKQTLPDSPEMSCHLHIFFQIFKTQLGPLLSNLL